MLDLLTVYYFLEDGFVSLFLWRSSSIVTIPLPDIKTFSLRWVNIGLPLHSLTAFICATRLVENLQLLPSFSFGCVAWLLFATMEMRSHSPNPWKRSKPLTKMLYAFVMGKKVFGAQTIDQNENLDAIREHESKWKLRLKDAEEKAALKALEYQKQQEEYLKEMNEIGEDTDISTKIGGFSIDPTKQWLLPIQVIISDSFLSITKTILIVQPSNIFRIIQEWLGIICESIRVTKNVIVWEECYISFWIALGSFMLSVMSYFVPWSFLTKWIMRIIGK